MILKSKFFYDNLSIWYDQYSGTRKEYNVSVNKIITERISRTPKLSILDVGCGTGSRILDINSKLGLKDIELVDESSEMLEIATRKTNFKCNQIDITNPEESLGRTFGVILCLWNVLGHSGSKIKCLNSLQFLRKHLENKESLLFIDVNNKYNISQYGFFRVLKNMSLDLFRVSFLNGNFKTSILVGARNLTTEVHLFSPFEMRKYLNSCDLKIEKEFYVDYKTGKIRSSWLRGQLVYILKKHV